MTRDMVCMYETEMTLGEVMGMVERYPYFHGFPIVESAQCKYLRGYITTRSVRNACAVEAKSSPGGLGYDSKVSFQLGHSSAQNPGSSSFEYYWSSWTDHFLPVVLHTTPVIAVYDLFVHMGLRHVLVVHDGLLCGIVSKKDLLAYVDNSEDILQKYFF